jgi:hypothetical protein
VIPKPLVGELVGVVEDDLDRAAQGFLRAPKDGDKVAERNDADHEQVDVALRALLAAREGPEDERDPDFLLIRFECGAQDVVQTNRLLKCGLEFAANRGVAVCLIVDSAAIAPTAQEPDLRQVREFSLQRRGWPPQVAGEIARVPPPVGMQERRRQ